MEETVLKTPLYGKHVEHGGKMVPFAGYSLPVQYEGVIAEHMAVRTALGLFDVSHSPVRTRSPTFKTCCATIMKDSPSGASVIAPC